jgi:single-strand DNA-binding protein
VPVSPEETTNQVKEKQMNSIQLVGRLTRDPETSVTKGGTKVAKLRLAVPRRPRDGEEQSPVYVDVTVYGAGAEPVATYTAKGRQVAVSGRLEYREWKTEDGSLRSKHEVVADHVQFLGSPVRDTESAEEPASVA